MSHSESLRSIFVDRWHPVAWLTIVILALYSPSVLFEFCYLDDYHLVEQNADFLSDLSNLPRLFSENTFVLQNRSRAYYRPLLFVSFMLDAQIFGTSAGGYHLHNVLLHVVVSVLFFALLRKLKIEPAPALAWTMLYATHPVLTRTVAWIPGRCDLLLSVFLLVSLMGFIMYTRTKSKAAYIIHLVMLTLALFTKETAVFLIPLCVAYLGFLNSNEGNLVSRPKTPSQLNLGANSKLIAAIRGTLWIEWGIIVLAWIAIRTSVLGEVSAQVSPIAIARSVWEALPGLIQMYGKALIPLDLSPLPLQQDSSCLWGVLAVLLTVAFFWTHEKTQNNVSAWGFSWFVVFLVPVFLRPMNETSRDLTLMEHRLGLPLMGLLIAWSASNGTRLISRFPKSAFGLWLGVFSLFVLQSRTRAAEFHDPLAFWQTAVKTSPHSVFAHKNLGVIYYILGHPRLAEAHYRRALELRPGELYVHNNLGLVYMDQGLLAEAEREFKQEIEQHPGYEKPYFNMARLYCMQGRHAEAAYWLNRGVQARSRSSGTVPLFDTLKPDWLEQQ